MVVFPQSLELLPYSHCDARIAFQIRPDCFTHPGGDTVVMVRLKEHLEKLGLHIDVSYDINKHLEEYDLVHLFNLCAPDTIEPIARVVHQLRKPLVIHAFQENCPQYLAKSKAVMPIFRRYLELGQPQGYLGELTDLLRNTAPSGEVTSRFVLEHASSIFVSGRAERDHIKGMAPEAHTTIVHYGVSLDPAGNDGDLFARAFGVRDFVLCVGRLETRKNQLMLLASLEHEDIPVVFADGGFSYQQEYEGMCKAFKRKAPTIFTGRLSDEMLASAYAAAKVHCLPSWQELPGLVSIEAALGGCNIVATSWGTIHDYLGNSCWYCEPDNPEDIRNQTLCALQSPQDQAAGIRVAACTWDKAASGILGEYQHVVPHIGMSGSRSSPRTSVDLSEPIRQMSEGEMRMHVGFDAKRQKPRERVEIVMPVFYREDETHCTLEQLSRTTDNYSLIIVNNGFDDTDFLKDLCPSRYIENKNNVGAIRAINQGLQVAKGEYICVLHNDVLIHEDCWLDHIIEFMERRPDVGLVGLAGRHSINEDGSPDFSTTVINMPGYPMRNKRIWRLTEVATIDGLGWVMRNVSFRLDETLGLMHFYDLDLSLQYIQAGYRVYVAAVEIEHVGDDKKLTSRNHEKYLSLIGGDDYSHYESTRKKFHSKWKDLLPLTRGFIDETSAYYRIDELVAESEQIRDYVYNLDDYVYNLENQIVSLKDGYKSLEDGYKSLEEYTKRVEAAYSSKLATIETLQAEAKSFSVRNFMKIQLRRCGISTTDSAHGSDSPPP